MTADRDKVQPSSCYLHLHLIHHQLQLHMYKVWPDTSSCTPDNTRQKLVSCGMMTHAQLDLVLAEMQVQAQIP